MKVEYGTTQDIESWMELVQRVSWNFPGLETEAAIKDHRRTVLRFMGENRALCVKDAEKVVGILLLSKKRNMSSGRWKAPLSISAKPNSRTASAA